MVSTASTSGLGPFRQGSNPCAPTDKEKEDDFESHPLFLYLPELRRDSNRQKLSKILFSRTISQCASMNASERAFSAAEDKEFVSVDEQTTRKSLRPLCMRQGFEPAEAKQIDFQQKSNVACVDECEEYEPAHRQAGIQLCRGQGKSERRRVNDAEIPAPRQV